MKFRDVNELLTGFVAINGKQGSGKTLLATMLAYADYRRGREIYSNYPVKFPHVPIHSIRDIERAENGTVVLDEAYQLVDARRSSSKKNVFISLIFAKARKKGLRYITTQQYWRTIDVRLRDHADWILFPRIIDVVEEGDKLLPSEMSVLVYTRNSVGDTELYDVYNFRIPRKALGLYDTTADVYEWEDEEDEPKRKVRKPKVTIEDFV